jgi:hypothetical protein
MDAIQKRIVYLHIKSHKKGISSVEAFDYYGTTRLSAIIWKLRHDGVNIDSVPCQCKNRYGHNTNFVRYVYKGRKA